MNFEIKSKDFKVTEAVETYVDEKLEKLVHYSKNIESIHVWLSSGKEKHSEKKFEAKALVHLPGKIYLEGKEFGRTMHESIDLLSENLERQLERHSHKN